MPHHGLLIAVSIACFATPLAAQSAEDNTPRRSKNGEFLFKHYPPRALSAREQGKVGFRVTLDRDGSLTSCDVTQSSGSAALDNETCDLMIHYARFQPVRDGDGNTVRATHDGFVNWRLPEELAGEATAAPVSRTAAADPEKIICRRSKKTGSLVGSTKQCMTRGDWLRAERQAREDGERAQGSGWSNGVPPTGI